MAVGLRIVRNNKLEKLFTKIPKYRKANTISWKKVKSTIIEKLYQYIDTGCSKHRRHISVPLEWKCKVIDKADENIKLCVTKHLQDFIRVYFSKASLKMLRMIFIITLFSYRLKSLTGEFHLFVNNFPSHIRMGLNHNNTSANKGYIPVHKNNNQVVSHISRK